MNKSLDYVTHIVSYVDLGELKEVYVEADSNHQAIMRVKQMWEERNKGYPLEECTGKWKAKLLTNKVSRITI